MDAHTALRRKALSFPTVQLHLSSPITSVDPIAGLVTVGDGTAMRADLIVGADGVHSVTIGALDGGERALTQGAGIMYYRFMVPTAVALRNPSVLAFLSGWDFRHESTGFHKLVNGCRQVLVQYACRGGTLLNFAFVTPSARQDMAPIEGWNHVVGLDELLQVINEYPEHFKELARMAIEIRKFEGMDRQLTGAFVKGKLVCIGDAAHTIPPPHSAGAGTGIEEAAALGEVFSYDAPSRVARVEALLTQYDRLRYKRGATVKLSSDWILTKFSGLPMQEIQGVDVIEDEQEFLDYIWSHDAVQEVKGRFVI